MALRWGRRAGDRISSFFLGDQEIHLGECILLHSSEENPYVGILTRMWEDKQTKKIAVHWLYRKSDLPGGGFDGIADNELLLAIGDTEQENPLTVVIGKARCRMMQREVAAGYDYFMHRGFDFARRMIVEDIGESIPPAMLQAPPPEIYTPLRPGISIGKRPRSTRPAPPPEKRAPPPPPPEKRALPPPPPGKRPASAQPQPEKRTAPAPPPVEKKRPAPPSETPVKKARMPPPPPVRRPAPPFAPTPLREDPPSQVKRPLPLAKATKPATSALPERKIFKDPPFEELLEEGYAEGRVMLLQNFELGFTSDQVKEALEMVGPKTRIYVQVIPEKQLPTYVRTGQAIVVVDTVVQFKQLMTTLNENVLVLTDNGRPCIASVLQRPSKETAFPGHLPLEQYRQQSRMTGRATEKFKNAVSTAHCSQPNTIEFEMALQWRVLSQRHEMELKELTEMQLAEEKQFT